MALSLLPLMLHALTLKICFISHLFNKPVRPGVINFLQFLKMIKHLHIANSSLSSALSFLAPSKLANCVENVRLNHSQRRTVEFSPFS